MRRRPPGIVSASTASLYAPKASAPFQIWVPDTRKPGFAEEARRQSLAVSNDPHEQEIYDSIDLVMEGTEWN